MGEKSRAYGCFLTWEQEKNIEKCVKEMEENGIESRAVENAHKWLNEYPEEKEKMNLLYRPFYEIKSQK